MASIGESFRSLRKFFGASRRCSAGFKTCHVVDFKIVMTTLCAVAAETRLNETRSGFDRCDKIGLLTNYPGGWRVIFAPTPFTNEQP